MTKTIIVTNADKRASLAVIRSLGRKGLKVIACSDTKLSPGFYSKYCSKHRIYPSPKKDVKKFVCWLNKLCETIQNPIIFPIGDDINLILIKHEVRAKIISSDPIEFAHNKYKLFNFASKCGILVPKTNLITKQSELKSKKFPCILKPCRSMYIKNNKVLSTKVHTAHTQKELLEKGGKLLNEVGEFLLQEYVAGYGVGYFAIAKNGEVLSDFQHKRIREVPYTGGPSSLRESIYDSDLDKASSKLLKKLSWSGLAMVEFRKDGNKLYLMEINGRAWGSLALADHAGVDFPYDAYKLLLNKAVKRSEYLLDIKCRWLIPGDIYHIISILKSSLPASDKLLRLKSFSSVKDQKFDYIQKDDPLPAITFSLFLILLSLRRTIT
jgi:predicted ATP-grasp superfamily ATP-dependent carboligase